MRCINCGKKVPEGASFCTKCGAPVVLPQQPGQVNANDVNANGANTNNANAGNANYGGNPYPYPYPPQPSKAKKTIKTIVITMGIILLTVIVMLAGFVIYEQQRENEELQDRYENTVDRNVERGIEGIWNLLFE